MTHEEAQLQTKLKIAAALKQAMAHKPLAKITVSELVAASNVNRKTFYYHFQDVYALLKWTLEQEAIEVVRGFDLLLDYEDAVRFVIRYIRENEHILNCAHDSAGRDELKQFIAGNLRALVDQVIGDCARQNKLEVDPGFRQFLCSFVTEAISGLLVTSFTHKTVPDQEAAVSYFRVILASLPDILKHGVVAGA